MLDSSIHEHILRKRKLSGFHFMDIFAAWIGVETNVTDARYAIPDFPEDRNIQITDGQKLSPYDQLSDNPAVVGEE